MAEQEELAQWFVIQTLSGQEFKVKQSIERRRELEDVEDVVHEVIIPTEMVSEVRHGRKTQTERKFFPGYILIKVSLYDAEGNTQHLPWYFVRDTPGVIGFVGGEKPVPLSAGEVADMLQQGGKGEEISKPKVQFEVGETVTIKDGAFENFEGTIESVDPDRGKLQVSVSIFGRSTPVEVEYWQVERN